MSPVKELTVVNLVLPWNMKTEELVYEVKFREVSAEYPNETLCKTALF
jgi:hypothetical protein